MAKKKLIRVKAVQDNDGHWYVIPLNLFEQFEKELDEDSEEMSTKYGEYMTGGDLNNRQLYAREK